MRGDEWLGIIEAAITKSGLPYLVVSCQSNRNGAACFARVEHRRTRALRQLTLPPGVIAPEEMRNEIIHQMRAFNVNVPAACPKGHLSVLPFEREELQHFVAGGGLTFYCDVCDTFREPTAADIATIERLLDEIVA